MARDRQRSKARQRQQQRRDERLAQRRETPAAPPAEEAEREAELEQEVDRAIGAPVHDLGTSRRTFAEAVPEPSFETDDESLYEEAEPSGAGDGSGVPVAGSDGGGAAAARGPRS